MIAKKTAPVLAARLQRNREEAKRQKAESEARYREAFAHSLMKVSS